ncbi:MAG: DNA cytosine methyltransferase [Bacteroidetes bacterium]|nr:MAG: DNA cytosine methyltransferase [Bacteroidota bacterium]
MPSFTSLEICAGAGGQAIGIENAGYEHVALVEIDSHACATLRQNRPEWEVFELDVRAFSGEDYAGKIDLLSGGVPCPPFSIAGKQLGEYDDRDLFPEAIRLTKEIDPKAVMLENVKGILSSKFEEYRMSIVRAFNDMDYEVFWRILNASDYGVPQLRPRAVLVAIKREYSPFFQWPDKHPQASPTVGDALAPLMGSMGWEGLTDWVKKANKIAPTLVGGSKKHGGPDLGPTRARKAWAEMGVNGKSLANTPPEKGFEGMPRLTTEMAAVLQGFPEDWIFTGGKTAAYRQVGNAFPPPVAEAVATAINHALQKRELENSSQPSPIQEAWTLFS